VSTDAVLLDRSRDHLRRRLAVNRVAEALATLAAFAAVALLVIMVVSVARRGLPALDLDFLTETPKPFNFTNEPSGIAPALVGTAILVALATAMALPFGVLVAIYVVEFAHARVRDGVSLTLDVLNGIPSIVLGIFVFGLLIAGHRQSGLAASFALAIIMLPLVARATQEVLMLVPASAREAGLALGASRWKKIVTVVLPQTVGGILTGTTLAVARVAGETAPLLFTSSLVGTSISFDPREPLVSIPLTIFEYSESPDPHDHAQAWAAGLVLISFILVASLTARTLAARSRRKMGLER
jgi:phosphate transport system permease protein